MKKSTIVYLISSTILMIFISANQIYGCGSCESSWYYDGYTNPDGESNCMKQNSQGTYVIDEISVTKGYSYEIKCDRYKINGAENLKKEGPYTGGINGGAAFRPYDDCGEGEIGTVKNLECTTTLSHHGMSKPINIVYKITHNHTH